VIFELRPRFGVLGNVLVQVPPGLVGEDDAVLGIEQHDVFGKRFDRQSELLQLGQAGLFQGLRGARGRGHSPDLQMVERTWLMNATRTSMGFRTAVDRLWLQACVTECLLATADREGAR
jgi:hypothetical protein